MTDAASSGFHVVIPARMGSVRFPRKVLAPICGVPMVVRVAAAGTASGAASVTVATDDAEIVRACEAHQIAAVMTASTHQSGTDRVCEVADSRGWADETVVVNVQGDEPLMPAALIAACADAARHADIATPCHPIDTVEEFLSPHAVKVVTDSRDRALYFSRAAIPTHRESVLAGRPQLPATGALRHIGLYAYKVAALRQIAMLPPASVEQDESLEQLRALHAGLAIQMVRTGAAPGPGVDTPDDLARVEQLVAATGLQ